MENKNGKSWDGWINDVNIMICLSWGDTDTTPVTVDGSEIPNNHLGCIPNAS